MKDGKCTCKDCMKDGKCIKDGKCAKDSKCTSCKTGKENSAKDKNTCEKNMKSCPKK